MDFITQVQETLLSHLPTIVEDYQGKTEAENLSEMEKQVKQMAHDLGNEVMRLWLEAQDEKYPSDQKACECGADAKYVRRREGMSITVQGRVYYRRAYYLCEHCQCGFYPLDRKLGIRPGEMSEEVLKLAALLGIQEAFVPSQKVLAETTLLDLSPNSVRTATHRIAEAVLTEEAAQIEQSQQLEAQLDRKRTDNKPQRLYGSIDGFYAMLKSGGHEMKTGTWWTVNDKGKATDIRYYVDTVRANAFSDLVWATGFKHHADQAVELIFVADGADWIWKIVEHHYPQAVQIVDWYHACQYIAPVAKQAFKDTSQQQAWIKQVRDDLWQGKLDKVIVACQQHVQSDLKSDEDKAQQAVTYFQNNRHRMHYPAYREQGYQIGSGTMESGCKQIGLQRLRIAGARWSEEGVRKVAKARAAYLTDQWSKLNLQSTTLPQVA